MSTKINGFHIDVSRGPNWLFLRLDPGGTGLEQELANGLWNLASRHHLFKVVIEFGRGFDKLSPTMIAQLDAFRARLEDHDGALRICGLNSASSRELTEALRRSKHDSRDKGYSHLLPVHETLKDEALALYIDPGTATSAELAELLSELSKLYQLSGGRGVSFQIAGAREPAIA